MAAGSKNLSFIGLTCMLLLATTALATPTPLESFIQAHAGSIRKGIKPQKNEKKEETFNFWDDLINNALEMANQGQGAHDLELAIATIPACKEKVNRLNDLVKGLKSANGNVDAHLVASEVDKITAKIVQSCQPPCLGEAGHLGVHPAEGDGQTQPEDDDDLISSDGGDEAH